jgi:hypothetical protein
VVAAAVVPAAKRVGARAKARQMAKVFAMNQMLPIGIVTTAVAVVRVAVAGDEAVGGLCAVAVVGHAVESSEVEAVVAGEQLQPRVVEAVATVGLDMRTCMVTGTVSMAHKVVGGDGEDGGDVEAVAGAGRNRQPNDTRYMIRHVCV